MQCSKEYVFHCSELWECIHCSWIQALGSMLRIANIREQNIHTRRTEPNRLHGAERQKVVVLIFLRGYDVSVCAFESAMIIVLIGLKCQGELVMRYMIYSVCLFFMAVSLIGCDVDRLSKDNIMDAYDSLLNISEYTANCHEMAEGINGVLDKYRQSMVSETVEHWPCDPLRIEEKEEAALYTSLKKKTDKLLSNELYGKCLNDVEVSRARMELESIFYQIKMRTFSKCRDNSDVSKTKDKAFSEILNCVYNIENLIDLSAKVDLSIGNCDEMGRMLSDYLKDSVLRNLHDNFLIIKYFESPEYAQLYQMRILHLNSNQSYIACIQNPAVRRAMDGFSDTVYRAINGLPYEAPKMPAAAEPVPAAVPHHAAADSGAENNNPAEDNANDAKKDEAGAQKSQKTKKKVRFEPPRPWDNEVALPF